MTANTGVQNNDGEMFEVVLRRARRERLGVLCTVFPSQGLLTLRGDVFV